LNIGDQATSYLHTLMKTVPAMLLTVVASAALSSIAHGAGFATSPIQKVLTMLADLEAKVTSEGEKAKALYAEKLKFCKSEPKSLSFEIKTASSEVKELTAAIENFEAQIISITSKIEEITASIASSDADLTSATEVRTKESADYKASLAEIEETISMLERAIAILERQGGASMLQVQGASDMTQALAAIVHAEALSSADAAKLTALLQSSDSAKDEDEDMGAPAGAVYTSSSGGIIDTLNDLLEKATAQRDELHKAEIASQQSFEMLKQSLTDAIKEGKKNLSAAKKEISLCKEQKATASGDLTVTSKDLSEDKASLAKVEQECMTAAENFEVESSARTEELKALGDAKKVIQESTGAAASVTYGLAQTVSLIQTQSSKSRMEPTNFRVLRFVRDMARRNSGPALAQLSKRMMNVMQVCQKTGEDPFAKVKSLIMGMIEKLEEEAGADATEKAFCDKETGETTAKKEESEALIEKKTSLIDSAVAKSSQLKERVAVLQDELAKLSKKQATMDKLRMEEKASFTQAKADMEAGIEGVQLALKVLKEYYAKKDDSASEGAASGIITLLETCESDFQKSLTEDTADEEAAATAYEETTKENEISKVTKEQDVKYKVKEAAELDKETAELKSDKASAADQLASLVEYLSSLNVRCVAKPETYAERTAKRASELAGLKEALSILEGESSLLQRKTSRRTLRGHIRA